VGLKRFVKRVARKSWDANKYLFGGGAVKDVLAKSVSTVQTKNPELAGAALTAASVTPGLGDILGLLGLGASAPPPVYDPGPSSFEEEAPEPELAPGIDSRTLLLAGGALAAVYLLTRRK
jgi:hypothetical protein